MGVLRRESPAAAPAMNDVHSILGPESTFDGKLTFRGSVRIDGRFSGQIEADGHLIIGPDAVVKADARVGHLVVFGELEGDLEASTGIEIHASAKVRGNVVSAQVMIEKGASFDGSCSMSRSPANGLDDETATEMRIDAAEAHVAH